MRTVLKRVLDINLSIQLLIIFAVVLMFGAQMPYTLKASLLTMSQFLQNCLGFALPFIVFGCIFNCLVGQQERALSFIATLLSLATVSNALSSLVAYWVGSLSFRYLNLTVKPLNQDPAHALNPLFNVDISPWVKNEHALVLGMALGIICVIYKVPQAPRIGQRITQVINAFLSKVLVPLIPLFAVGFIVRMQHEGILVQLLANYLPIIVMVLATSLFYTALMFGLATRFQPKVWWESMRNCVPASLAAFSAMSSLAAMPLTLQAAIKNTKQPRIAEAVVPATVNIHMVGDSVAIMMVSFAILMSQGTPLPNFHQFLLFLPWFLLARFGVAAIPGGSIVILLPLLETYFGILPSMTALTWALYMLFEPIVSGTNVAGNSAFVMMITRILSPKPKLS